MMGLGGRRGTALLHLRELTVITWFGSLKGSCSLSTVRNPCFSALPFAIWIVRFGILTTTLDVRIRFSESKDLLCARIFTDESRDSQANRFPTLRMTEWRQGRERLQNSFSNSSHGRL